MKNIIICSDGTWQSPESDTSTHVLRLAEGIAPEDAAGNKQVVFYDWGVGSEGDKFSGGITGKGIDKNIQDCYRFVVHNYEPGDALYLFGFSRGAYTVRSLAGLIRNCGILRREHAEKVGHAYALYRNRGPASAPGREKAETFRKNYAVADVSRIHFIGVFDTVGALGDIPGEWMAREAQACGLGLEPHFLLRLNPDYAGRKHNEYKGFYKAMGRKHIRPVEPVLHVSVRRRWEDESVPYKSPGLAELVGRVGWSGVVLVGTD